MLSLRERPVVRYDDQGVAVYGEPRYCCLGVLAEINGVLSYEGQCETTTGRKPKTVHHEGFLSRSVAKDTGLQYTTQKHLAAMNDASESVGYKTHSFADIADLIEKEL